MNCSSENGAGGSAASGAGAGAGAAGDGGAEGAMAGRGMGGGVTVDASGRAAVWSDESDESDESDGAGIMAGGGAACGRGSRVGVAPGDCSRRTSSCNWLTWLASSAKIARFLRDRLLAWLALTNATMGPKMSQSKSSSKSSIRSRYMPSMTVGGTFRR